MKDIERLTVKSDYVDGSYYVDNMGVGEAKDNATYELSCKDYCQSRDGYCNQCAIQQAFDRLGEYEDIGLSPEEVKKLKAAASAFKEE